MNNRGNKDSNPPPMPLSNPPSSPEPNSLPSPPPKSTVQYSIAFDNKNGWSFYSSLWGWKYLTAAINRTIRQSNINRYDQAGKFEIRHLLTTKRINIGLFIIIMLTVTKILDGLSHQRWVFIYQLHISFLIINMFINYPY